jgi:site-specific recombinase XerD
MKNDVYQATDDLNRELKRWKGIEFSGANRTAAEEFKERIMKDNIKDTTRKDHLQNIRILAPHIDFNLKTADKSDIRELVRKINDDHIRQRDGSRYAAWSKKDLRSSLKKFYRVGLDRPEVASYFRTHPKERDKPDLQAIDIPSKQDIARLANLMDDDLYSSVLWLHWSLGVRVKELMNIKRRGVRKHKGLLWVDVPTGEKTGPRSIPVLHRQEDLTTLRKKGRRSNSSFLLSDKQNKPMKYNAYEQQFRAAAEYVDTAAILTPKMVRKSRATHMASRKDVNAPKLQKYFGWSDLSTAEFYIQLADSALEDLVDEYRPDLPEIEGGDRKKSPPPDMYA